MNQADARDAVNAVDAVNAANGNGKASILLVDDNPANLITVENVLADLDQHLVEAHSGREALRHLLERDFAVIVLDVNMPDMSGFETASLIRARPRSKHTPIVFMTAVSQSDASAMLGYELGAVDYIYTPVAPEVIRAKVRVFVDLFRMNQTLQHQSDALERANEQLEQRLQEIQRLNGRLEATVEALDRDVAERRAAEAALRESQARLQMLHEIDRAILAAKSPGDIAQAVVPQVRRAVGCERASVLLFDPEEPTACVLAVDTVTDTHMRHEERIALDGYRPLASCKRGEVGYVEDLAALPSLSPLELALLNEGLRAWAAIPLMAGSQLIGSLDLARGQAGPFAPDSIELARQVADSLAVAIQNARLHEQIELSRTRLQGLSRRLVEVQEEERRAIARELHDEAGQALTALMLGLGQIGREAGSEAIAEQVQALKKLTDEIMEELHRLAVDLRPASLDRLGLVPALNQYVDAINQRGRLQVEMAAVGFDDGRLPQDTETALYRMVQEALTNVARHAQARHADVLVHRRAESILATVSDDGIGFDVEAATRSGRLGLAGMLERAEMLGGALTIESAPGKGTSIYVEVPCAAAPA